MVNDVLAAKKNDPGSSTSGFWGLQPNDDGTSGGDNGNGGDSSMQTPPAAPIPGDGKVDDFSNRFGCPTSTFDSDYWFALCALGPVMGHSGDGGGDGLSEGVFGSMMNDNYDPVSFGGGGGDDFSFLTTPQAAFVPVVNSRNFQVGGLGAGASTTTTTGSGWPTATTTTTQNDALKMADPLSADPSTAAPAAPSSSLPDDAANPSQRWRLGILEAINW
jgi:hypothetical protein